MGTRQTVLQIAQHAVHTFVLWRVAYLAGAEYINRMGAVGVGDSVEAGREPSDKTLQPGARLLTDKSLGG